MGRFKSLSAGVRRENQGQTPDHLLRFWNRWLLGRDSSGMLDRFCDENGIKARHFVCYAYADPEVGLSAHLHLICRLRLRRRIEPVFDLWKQKVVFKFRADLFDAFGLRILEPGNVAELQLPDRPEWLAHYTNEDLEPVRRMDLLRPLRAGHFPDDIRTIAGGTGNTEPEVVWARTRRLLPDGDIECTLLNQPHQSLDIDSGDSVRVRVREVPGGIQSVCIGRFQESRRGLSGMLSRWTRSDF